MENQFDGQLRHNSKTWILAALGEEVALSQDAMSTAAVGRVFVKPIGENGIERESLAVPLTDPGKTVGEFKHELVKRLQLSSEYASEEYELRLSSNGVLLQDGDLAGAILRSDDFITLCPRGQYHSATTSEESLYQSIYESHIRHNPDKKSEKEIELDGYSLTIEELISIGLGHYQVKLSESAKEKVRSSRKIIDDIVSEERVVYGVTTGFGKFAGVFIPKEKAVELQLNLIRSHSCGVGPPLSASRTRMLLALRINVLSKGFSGVRLETLQQLVDTLNASCLSYVPEKGTVGASGDLAPLSHLALGLIGEGRMWSPKSGWGSARDVLAAHGLTPIQLEPKEGLALINGTQLITSLGAEALYRADLIARQADVIAALSIDVLKGTPRAFDQDIHLNRPHHGQQMVASRLRALLDSNVYPSEIRESHKNCSRVQDPYTMRCVPQVHGVVHDTLSFVRGILSTEMNSATDNPMVLANRKETISGGNFHGEYPAKALDYLAISIHEVCNMSERRLERLIHPAYSDLPAFLVQDGGLNSGFMIAQCTAAALVSENKVLTHPSSVDSITTSAGTEDHVSMGGFAARKALTVVEHVENVVAIELLAACQGLEFLRPCKTTTPLEEVHKLVRSVVKSWDHDRFMAPDIAAVVKLLQEGKVWDTVQPYIAAYEEYSVTPPTSGSHTHTPLIPL